MKRVIAVVVVMSFSALFTAFALGADETVALNDLPEAVKATLNKEAGTAPILEIERETEDGETIYSAKFQTSEGTVEIEIDVEGKLLVTEMEDDDEEDGGGDDGEEDGTGNYAWEDLPGAVQAQLTAVYPGVDFDAFEVETEEGYTYYEAEYTLDGIAHAVKLTGDGYVVEHEAKTTADALPAAVLDQIKAAYPGGVIEETESVELVFYEVAVKDNGKVREIKLLANGSVLDGDD